VWADGQTDRLAQSICLISLQCVAKNGPKIWSNWQIRPGGLA